MKNMRAVVLTAVMMGMSVGALRADDGMDPNMKMPKGTSASEHKKHKHKKTENPTKSTPTNENITPVDPGTKKTPKELSNGANSNEPNMEKMKGMKQK